ncbi:hypothetical protein VNO77_27733 [Canavalia gladiata]|uniref:Uncharacterized protein n=1 Tax=Canavalia gladiata TaxID=3824 RepID=A0AAN9KV71_CANGL
MLVDETSFAWNSLVHDGSLSTYLSFIPPSLLWNRRRTNTNHRGSLERPTHAELSHVRRAFSARVQVQPRAYSDHVEVSTSQTRRPLSMPPSMDVETHPKEENAPGASSLHKVAKIRPDPNKAQIGKNPYV